MTTSSPTNSINIDPFVSRFLDSAESGRVEDLARSYVKMWKLKLPVTLTCEDSNLYKVFDGSGHRIALTLEVLQALADDSGDETSAQAYKARIILFHELTHAVQVEHRGWDGLISARRLYEVHADILAAYWVCNELGLNIASGLELLSEAFALARSDNYLDRDGRASSLRHGVFTSLARLRDRGELEICECTREQLFEDSLKSAQKEIGGAEAVARIQAGNSVGAGPQTDHSEQGI